MKILVINQILRTADNKNIPRVESIRDSMIVGMCDGFSRLGHDVTLAAGKEFSPSSDEKYNFNVLFFISNFRFLFPPSMIPLSLSLFFYIFKNSRKFDLFVSSEIFSFSSLFLAVFFPKKTIVWQELNCHQRKFFSIPSKLWHKSVVPLFFKNVAAIVPRSSSARDFISKYLHGNVSKKCVDHGIDLDKHIHSREKRNQVICVSQLIKRKNVKSVLRKFADYLKLEGVNDCLLVIAGRGEEYEDLQCLASELGVLENVVFLGFVEHVVLNKHVRESKALLLDTISDLNVVAIQEAIVAGTPVITNCVPASSGYIQKYCLGIAKNDWQASDIKYVIDNNSLLVDNCIAVRDNWSNLSAAKSLIMCFCGVGN